MKVGEEYVAQNGQKVILCNCNFGSTGCKGCYFNLHRELPCPTQNNESKLKDIYTKEDHLLCKDYLSGRYIFKTPEQMKEDNNTQVKQDDHIYWQ